ncbi:MAG: DUF1428 domain-containing protein [Pseudomonadota bacterium]
MTYVDVMVAAVPAANKNAYIAHAETFGKIAKENGALRSTDSWGVDVPSGEVTSMPMAVQCKDDEVVAVGWIEWPSKQTRDAGWEKMMQDPRMDPQTNPMPFDGRRLIFGGFEMLLDH